MTVAQKQKAYRRGRSAETLAILLLRLKGYRILARRFRSPFGEIDIVARRGRLLAFVEVKARSSRGAALEAVTRHQQRRIERASLAFLQIHPHMAGLQNRFDVIVLTAHGLPRHLADAWRP